MKHIFNYKLFIKEDADTEEVVDDSKYSDLKSEVLEMVERSVNTSDNKTKEDFIEAYKKDPESSQIEGLINDADIYEFYLKWRNDIDDILSTINFFDEVPSENKVYSLYEYIINGTKKAVSEIISNL